jgi:superfamily II DNA/RNA helicase
VQRGINALGFTRPTPVQAQAIPALCSGLDVLAEAPAGSGKTCAFVAPALSKVNVALNMTQVLIIANTGPLANQTATVLDDLAKYMVPRPRIACLCKGERLAHGAGAPHIVVGTPMKLLDVCGLLESKSNDVLSLGAVRLCVLDEADEMLDRIQFVDQLQALIRKLPPTSAMAFFTATLSEHTTELISREKLLRPAPFFRLLKPDSAVRPALQHFSVGVGPNAGDGEWEKRALVVKDLCAQFRGGGVVVFTKSKLKLGCLTKVLGADVRGSRFTTDLDHFRKERAKVLLATDICGRGIDVPGVACVINVELPLSATNYTQRVGRAGRAGRAGTAITMFDDSEENDLKVFVRNLPHGLDPLPEDMSRLPGAGANTVAADARAGLSSISGAAPTLAPSTLAPLAVAVQPAQPEALVGAKAWVDAAAVPSPRPPELALVCNDAAPACDPEELLSKSAQLTQRVTELEALVAMLQAQAKVQGRILAQVEQQLRALAVEPLLDCSPPLQQPQPQQHPQLEVKSESTLDLSNESFEISFGSDEENHQDLVAPSDVATLVDEEASFPVAAKAEPVGPARVETHVDIVVDEPVNTMEKPKKSFLAVASSSGHVPSVPAVAPTRVKKTSFMPTSKLESKLVKISAKIPIESLRVGDVFKGKVVGKIDQGVFVRCGDGTREMAKDGFLRAAKFAVGSCLTVEVSRVAGGKVDLRLFG